MVSQARSRAPRARRGPASASLSQRRLDQPNLFITLGTQLPVMLQQLEQPPVRDRLIEPRRDELREAIACQ